MGGSLLTRHSSESAARVSLFQNCASTPHPRYHNQAKFAIHGLRVPQSTTGGILFTYNEQYHIMEEDSLDDEGFFEKESEE